MSQDRLFFVAASTIHGRGLFAAQQIPARTLLGRYEGESTDQDGEHVLWIEGDDGTWSGIDGKNMLRFVNHSSTPNAAFTLDELWSIRSIRRGEEVTFHYGSEYAD